MPRCRPPRFGIKTDNINKINLLIKLSSLLGLLLIKQFTISNMTKNNNKVIMYNELELKIH